MQAPRARRGDVAGGAPLLRRGLLLLAPIPAGQSAVLNPGRSHSQGHSHRRAQCPGVYWLGSLKDAPVWSACS